MKTTGTQLVTHLRPHTVHNSWLLQHRIDVLSAWWHYIKVTPNLKGWREEKLWQCLLFKSRTLWKVATVQSWWSSLIWQTKLRLLRMWEVKYLAVKPWYDVISVLWVWRASTVFPQQFQLLRTMGTLPGNQVEGALCCVSLRVLFPRPHLWTCTPWPPSHCPDVSNVGQRDQGGGAALSGLS